MNTEKNIRTLLIIKLTTSVMNLLATAAAGYLMAVAIWLSAFSGIIFARFSDLMLNASDYPSYVSGYIALYEAFGSIFSLGIAAFAAAFAIICFVAMIWFLIPTIHGFTLYKKLRKQQESAGMEGMVFWKPAKKDSILKIIFAVIPAVMLISGNPVTVKLVIAVLFLAVIVIREGVVLFRLSSSVK